MNIINIIQSSKPTLSREMADNIESPMRMNITCFSNKLEQRMMIVLLSQGVGFLHRLQDISDLFRNYSNLP